MRRKVNNSEIHEIKRYYEVPSEKVQEWSDTIENLTKQRDKLEVENERLKIKNEYLLNVIKMSEHIEIHTDAREDD